MDTWVSPCDNICGLEPGKGLEPQACSLGFGVAKLPRVDDLVGAANTGRDYTYRVFEGNVGDGGFQQGFDEGEGLGLLGLMAPKPAGATDGQVGAGRVSDHEVPIVMQNLANIALEMRARDFRGQKIAGPGIMATGQESIPNNAGELAGNQDAHGVNSI